MLLSEKKDQSMFLFQPLKSLEAKQGRFVVGADNDLYILNAQERDAGSFDQRIIHYSTDTELKTIAVDVSVENAMYDGR